MVRTSIAVLACVAGLAVFAGLGCGDDPPFSAPPTYRAPEDDGAGGEGGAGGEDGTGGAGGGVVPTGVWRRIVGPAFEVQPQEELSVCWAVRVERTMQVGAFRSTMGEGSHHFILYRTDQPQPEGVYPCGGALEILGWQFLYTAQEPREGVSFPPGTAAVIPEGHWLVFQSHYLNTSPDEPIGPSVTLEYYDLDGYVRKLGSIFLMNAELLIPPSSERTFERTCLIPTTYAIVGLGSHMHERGRLFEVEIVGGSRDGEIVYSNTNWDSPEYRAFDPLLILQPHTSLKFRCTFVNESGQDVFFGDSASDEMCITLGYYYPLDTEEAPSWTCITGP